MNEARRPLRTAYLILFAGVLSFTSSPILVRLAGGEGPGLAVAVWRTVLSAGLLLPFAVPRILPELRALTRKDWVMILAAGTMLGMHFITWIEALYHTSVASATVIITASPVFLAILGYLILREKLAWYVNTAILVSVLGSVFMAWGDAGDDTFPRALYGNMLALIGCLVFAGYLLIGRVVRQHMSWLGYVFPLYTVVALTTVVVAVGRGVPLFDYSWTFYALCLLMALFPQICGHGSVNYAVRYMPAALIGLAMLMEPVIASIVAVVLFQEVPTGTAIAGMITVLIGTTFVFLPALRGRRIPS